MGNKDQSRIFVVVPHAPSGSGDGRGVTSSLERAGILVTTKSSKSGGFLNHKHSSAARSVYFDFDGTEKGVKKTFYLVDDKNLCVLIVEGSDLAAAERTEEGLRKAFRGSEEAMSGTMKLQTALQAVQVAGVSEAFEIATFLAFLRERITGRSTGEVDYVTKCRRSLDDTKQKEQEKEKGRWGFTISYPQDHGKIGRINDPYGGLM